MEIQVDIEMATGKIGEAIGKAASFVKKLTEQAMRIRGIKGEISTCDEVIRENLLAIGEAYVKKYGNDANAEFAKQCAAIRNARKGKEELEADLKTAKAECRDGICPKCGKAK